jgi:hypothetical protein
VSDELPISYEQMRSLVVESLAQAGGGQLNDLRTAIPQVAGKHGLPPNLPHQPGPRGVHLGYRCAAMSPGLNPMPACPVRTRPAETARD